MTEHFRKLAKIVKEMFGDGLEREKTFEFQN